MAIELEKASIDSRGYGVSDSGVVREVSVSHSRSRIGSSMMCAP